MVRKLFFVVKPFVADFALDTSDAVDAELVIIHAGPSEKPFVAQVARSHQIWMLAHIVGFQRILIRQKSAAVFALVSFPVVPKFVLFVRVIRQIRLNFEFSSALATLVHLFTPKSVSPQLLFAAKSFRASRARSYKRRDLLN